MNTFQRIILVVGAVVILILLVTTPSYQHVQGSEFGGPGGIYPANKKATYANIWDWQSALVKCGGTALAVAAIYFAVGKKK